MKELILLTDLNDSIIGCCEKLEAHQKGLLHRAFSIFLFDGEHMLIQQRAAGKYHSAGLWANSCCSHQRDGEELTEAVHRRMKQELGADCEVEDLFTFVYRCVFPDGLIEYELDHVFVGSYSGSLHPDPEEIGTLEWIHCDELRRQLCEEPERFAVWFLTAAPEVLKRRKVIE